MAMSVLVRCWSGDTPTMPASPKSATFTCPEASTRMFSGLRSRWMMPLPWAKSMARHTWTMIFTADWGSMAPPAMSSRRLRPSTYSMTKYQVPSTCPRSMMLTMLGCERLASAEASFSKRATKSSLLARCRARTFTATSRPSESWRARYTSPMPPRPSVRRTS